MKEFWVRRFRSVRGRVAAIVAAVVLVIGAGVGGGVAVALSQGSHGSSVATAPVVRTTLVDTVQVSGAIGYNGSYTVAAPSGTSATQVSQQEQAVAQDQEQLSADEQAQSDAAATGNQAISVAQSNVSTAQSTLAAEQATKAKDCAGSAGSAACGQATQQVSKDQTALTLADQRLESVQLSAKTDDDENQAKVAADRVRLEGDQSMLNADRVTVMNPGGTYTWLPAVGQVIRQDQRVYAVNGEPVPLLYGATPAYRAFYAGMPDGGDVGELTHDLISLGYGDGLAQSDHYSPATAAAVERWQKAVGLPATGEIPLGEVVFEPGPIRVTSVTPTPGASTGDGGGGGASGGGGGGGGAVLTATGTTPVVNVNLGVSQEYLVKPGDAVSVALPDGTATVDGRVASVGTVATCPGGGSTGTGNGGSSPCSSPTVPVTITLNSVPAGAAVDQAPVNVNVTTQKAVNVLAVPVNALLALAGGGYGVHVVTGSGAIRLTRVTTGVHSTTLVQVSGPGIRAGMRVEVPSS